MYSITAKIFAIVLVFIFIFSSFTAISAININVEESVDNKDIKSFNTDNPVEKWAVVILMFPQGFEQLNYTINTLCSHGWRRDHIKYICNDNMTKQELIDAISWLDEKEDKNDISFIYLFAHGGRGRFVLSDGTMHYRRLNRELNKLDSDGIFLLLGPCHSGTAIPYLERKGRVIITSCRKNEINFGFHYSETYGLEGIADNIGNNDGKVSAEELYGYISMVPLGSGEYEQQPQISDRYQGELNLVDVNDDDRKVDQKQVIYDWLTYPLKIDNNTNIAQSFIPNSSKLTRIKLILSRDKFSNCEFKVAIKKHILGPDLTNISINLSDIPADIQKLTEFDIPDLNVIPGEKYYIICSAPEANSNSNICLKTMSKEVYPYGDMYVSNDAGFTWSYHHDHKDLFFITYDDKKLPLEVKIKKPRKAVYIHDKEIISFPKPLIFGNLTFEVTINESDGSILDHVYFYVDGERVKIDDKAPFAYTWNGYSPFIYRFKHNLKVEVKDIYGRTISKTITVWRFPNFFINLCI